MGLLARDLPLEGKVRFDSGIEFLKEFCFSLFVIGFVMVMVMMTVQAIA